MYEITTIVSDKNGLPSYRKDVTSELYFIPTIITVKKRNNGNNKIYKR